MNQREKNKCHEKKKSLDSMELGKSSCTSTWKAGVGALKSVQKR